MTLIAAWVDRNVPILIGDVLTSSQGVQITSEHHLPTRDDVHILIPPEWQTAIRTCQKVYIVCDTLCVAWADTQISAKAIINSRYAAD